MVEESKRQRKSHVVMTNTTRPDSMVEAHIPEYTIGVCQGKSPSGRLCRIYGELGDNLCISCWDKSLKRFWSETQLKRRENRRKRDADKKTTEQHEFIF